MKIENDGTNVFLYLCYLSARLSTVEGVASQDTVQSDVYCHY